MESARRFAILLIAIAALGSARSSVAVSAASLSGGITFDHATLNDPVRLVGEPDIAIDVKGGVYVSGPGGSTTQASWFWKSDDKGIQWHSIGVIPEGKSNGQNGGGDTELTIARNNDVFASDLQTLICNSTFRSFDEGNTFLTSEGCFPGTDRQWMAVFDPNTGAEGRRVYLAANGQAPGGCYVLVSIDNGVTYQPPDPIVNPAARIGGSCIGRLAVNPANGHIYVPGSSNTKVSLDGGITWLSRPRPSGVQGRFFAPIVVDTAGNLWQGWTTGCANPASSPCQAFVAYSTDEGGSWSAPIQVNTGPGSPAGTSPDLRQVLFPWITVGDPGRVALVYYGTTDTGRNSGFPGGDNALWHVYVSLSTNAMEAEPVFTQVQATEHPMHRGTICTGGFPGCLIANADRSMADFFMVDKDPDGRIFIAYNENSDLSLVVPEPPEYIGKPINAVIRLRTGPSLFADQGGLLPDPRPENVTIDSVAPGPAGLTVGGTHGLPPGNWTADPEGDAFFPVVPAAGPVQPALDIVEASASDDGANLTVTMRVKDLSPEALAQSFTTLGDPSWMVTWWQGRGGIGPETMSAPFDSHWFVKWAGGVVIQAGNASADFVFGRVGSVDTPALGAPTPKILTYTPAAAAVGSVIGNTISISVPLADLGGLAAGDKIDHVTAYTLSERTFESLPSVVDQAKSFSYVIGTPVAGQHQADGFVEVSRDPSFNSAVRAALDPVSDAWTALLPGAKCGITVYARQVLSKALYTPAWDDVQAGPVAALATRETKACGPRRP